MIPAKREINQEIDTRLRIWDSVPIRLREQEISCMQVGEMIPCELNPTGFQIIIYMVMGMCVRYHRNVYG